MTGTSRRTLLLSGLAGLGGLGAGSALAGCSSGAAGQAGASGASGAAGEAGAAGAAGASTAAASGAASTGPRAVARAFRGARQAGVVERPQAHAAFVALDLAPGADRDAVARLLTVWTDDIERLVSGRPPLTDVEPELAAVPASLTVTVGVGPRVVEAAGATVPTWLAPLPAFTLDRLEDRWSGGDVLLQVCADSPVTVAHAVRRLVASGAPMVRPRWVQRGFREPFEGSGLPMRNLLGQVDGTVQPEVDGADDALLWVGDGGPAWLRDGSALVLRRIAMDLQRWDAVDRVGRENAIGRRLSDGAPVTAPRGAGPDAPMDLAAVDRIGLPVIDEAAHVRRAHAAAPHERFLRRPYSYDEGDGAAPGGSGLLFAAFCADPVAQFVPVQRRLAEKDLLNLWTTPVGSTVVAVLPGARDGEVLGAAMLG